MRTFWLLLSLLLMGACSSPMPENAKIVDGVDANQYLGTWYEIARLDHSFERGLEQVSANYSMREDGGIKVINRGYDPIKKEWQEAEGKAYFTNPANPDKTYKGALKVSFFGPFYGSYNIIALDKVHYNYVMVSGGKDYLWILSRTQQLTYPIKQELMAQAKTLGYETDKLIHVNQVPDTREFKAGPHVTH